MEHEIDPQRQVKPTSLERPKVVLIRGEDRGEVLAYVLAGRIRQEIQKRGFEVAVADVPYALTRHRRVMKGEQLPDRSIEEENRCSYHERSQMLSDITAGLRGHRCIAFNLHNYDIEDVNPERRSPDAFRIGFQTSKFDRPSGEIFAFLDYDFINTYGQTPWTVEIPAVYKEMTVRIREKVRQNLARYRQSPSWYETKVVSMEQSRERGLTGDVVVLKTTDLIEKAIRSQETLEAFYKLFDLDPKIFGF